ncbi:polysaccharide pyruvyl transferase family protein [Plantibacter sp. YIM 135249]|uniref:polysaccharide pyruvyl transferase family protein n=1 Tax=Plantibacter sp. YIM 135249 TaxID=3423918 RepID=UPI003D32BBC9
MSNISPGDRTRVVILHAYSPRNSGDGLLVELARSIVAEAFGEADVVVIASDAEAFASDEVIQWTSPISLGGSELGRRLSMLLTGLTGPSRETRDAVAKADVIIAVGGGYLRGGHFAESVKSWGAHYGQVKLAARHGDRSVYLPQSIGPFRGLYLSMMRRQLGSVSAVFVRDDRSVRELAGVAGVRRAPDMAVLELGGAFAEPGELVAAARPIVIARDLNRPRHYYELLDQMAASGEYDWAVQSRGGGNNDTPLTTRLAGFDAPDLRDVLAENAPRVVISTRLHGALSSLIAGYPTIHLSYERKGWGAFEDLGLEDYVLSARDATLPEIEALRARIEGDPASYWSAIRDRSGHIADGHASIIDSLRSALASGRGPTASTGVASAGSSHL